LSVFLSAFLLGVIILLAYYLLQQSMAQFKHKQYSTKCTIKHLNATCAS